MGSIRQRGSKHSVPETALLIRDYARFRELGRQFAEGKIKALIVISGPGKGKSQIMKQALEAVRPTNADQFVNALNISLDNILARLAPGSTDQRSNQNQLICRLGFASKAIADRSNSTSKHISIVMHRY